jgi:Na+/H+ antiporter NhaA
MAFSEILLLSIVGLALGYTLGRIGHCYVNVWIGNPAWVPHHWIYGVFIMAGSFYFSLTLFIAMFSFGLGHFISDLKDFLELKFFSPDQDGKKRFFHID